MAAAKDELRRSIRRLRDSLAADEAKRAARKAARHLMALRDMSEGRSRSTLERVSLVALYAAVQGEIDTRPIASRVLARDIAVAYPRVVAGTRRLAFHRVTDPAALELGTFGIPEPAPDAPIVPLATIELLVVPGIAFDPRGRRLGWGKGYYDVTLAASSAALCVGLAYECQVVPEVPSEWNDVPMDIIVTETGVRRCSLDG